MRSRQLRQHGCGKLTFRELAGRRRLAAAKRDAERKVARLRTRAGQDQIAEARQTGQCFAARATGPSKPGELGKTAGGQRATPELAQATKLLKQSGAEFNKQNYAGSLYLATQTKRLASAAKGRLSGIGKGARPGESTFTAPVRLQTVRRSNVREGPGTNFKVLFTVEAGSSVTGYSYTDNWIRVTAENGRAGWVMRNLVGRGPEAMR